MKNQGKILIFFLLFQILPFGLTAQHAWAPGTEWFIIESSRADIIFPSGLEDEGRRAAALLDSSMEELARTLNVEKIRRWKLVLWYENSTANGYVTVSPRYSLWYSGVDGGRFSDGNWLSLMASHEGRHMAQFDRINQGGGRIFYALFGDGGTNYLATFCLPVWVFEGDAVLSETLLTEYGRGRSADFSVNMKAHILDGRLSYSEILNGSYKTIYPGWYEYGYYLVTHIRRVYGPEALGRIISIATAVPVPQLGFALGVRKVTGKWPSSLFRDMTDELEFIFRDQISEIDQAPVVIVDSPDEGEFYLFSNPVVLSSGDIAVTRTDLKHRKLLCVYSPSGTLLKTINYDHLTGTGLKAGGDDVYFSGFSVDPRWPGVEYRDIGSIDTATGDETRLTEKGRFLYPTPSPDGKRLFALEFFPDGRQEIAMFELPSKNRLPNIDPGKEFQISDPAWLPDGRLIAVFKGDEGRAIAFLDPETGEFEAVTGFSGGMIFDPLLWKDFIIYSSDEEGIRNIYALDPGTGRKFRITTRIYGASRPVVKGDTLYFIDSAGIQGGTLVRLELDPRKWTEIQTGGQEFHVDYYRPVLEIDPVLSSLDTPWFSQPLPESDYDIEPWSPVRGWFNVHSWGLIPEGFLDDPPEIRVGLFSDDVLGTLSVLGYGSWNFNEETPGGGVEITLSSLYPEISLEGLIRSRNKSEAEWDEAGVETELSLPLDFSYGLKTRNLKIALGGSCYTDLDDFNDSMTGYITGGIWWLSYLWGGYRRIYPLVGTEVIIHGAQDPTEEDYVYSGEARLALPGIFPSHSTRLTVAGELLEGSRPSNLTFCRGWDAVSGSRALTASLDYDFPILFPDLPMGFVFIRRTWGNVFGQAFYLDDELYSSAGFTHFFDFTLFNIEYLMLNLGVRVSYRFEDEKISVEMVIADGFGRELY